MGLGFMVRDERVHPRQKAHIVHTALPQAGVTWENETLLLLANYGVQPLTSKGMAEHASHLPPSLPLWFRMAPVLVHYSTRPAPSHPKPCRAGVSKPQRRLGFFISFAQNKQDIAAGEEVLSWSRQRVMSGYCRKCSSDTPSSPLPPSRSSEKKPRRETTERDLGCKRRVAAKRKPERSTLSLMGDSL